MRSAESCGERTHRSVVNVAAVLLQLRAEIICFAVFAGVQLRSGGGGAEI